LATVRLIILFSLVLVIVGFGQPTIDDCMMCHSDEELTKEIDDSTEISLFVDQKKYENSVHGGFECIDCHTTIQEAEHDVPLPKVQCAICHEDAQAVYSGSIHARETNIKGIIGAGCSDCHGKHYIMSSEDSTALSYKLNIEKTCGTCHTKPEVIAIFGKRGNGPVQAYHNSIHGRLLREAPEKNPPTCTNCHDYHAIYLMSDPRSTFNKLNRPKTCGKCHTREKDKYLQSIHWQAVEHGYFESPVCNDCHSEHYVVSPEERDAITNKLNLSSQLCANCHASKVMMQRFGLDPERFSSYMRTYHGLAQLKGSPEAANCTSCHEVHAIRSRLDQKSSIYPDNLMATCGKCHDNISHEFGQIAVHPIDQKARNPIAYIIRITYFWLVIVLIGGMALHNLIILFYYIREKMLKEGEGRMFQRFRPFEVYQHALLFFSFATLVVTGFALKFPESFWVQWLVDLGMTESIRATIHRIAAVVMIGISLLQFFYLVFNRHGRKDMKALTPSLEDLNHLWMNLKFHLHLSRNRPEFPRYDYTEKAEYLALIWGTAVMTITGLVLWFPEITMKIFPWWTFEVAEIVHYFEAILATLAILVWHWFFVIFHPEVYPLKLVWMRGKISEEEMQHHHPKEYEDLLKSDGQ
jgi:cytochrome b subunit of formate dehydrogenase